MRNARAIEYRPVFREFYGAPMHACRPVRISTLELDLAGQDPDAVLSTLQAHLGSLSVVEERSGCLEYSGAPLAARRTPTGVEVDVSWKISPATFGFAYLAKRGRLQMRYEPQMGRSLGALSVRIPRIQKRKLDTGDLNALIRRLPGFGWPG